MIAVVTGGSGFIGRNLIHRLVGDGHEVRCLVRPSGGTPPPGTRRFVVQFDEPRSLLACPALDDANVVFHLGGVTKAVWPRAFTAANVTPTRNLLGAICARRLYPKFVFVSSQAAAGPAPALQRPIDEDDLPRPVEPYGFSKLDAERVVESFADRIATTILRPCAAFGPHDRDFLKLFRMAQRGLLVYPGVARHWLSILHVEDLLDGLLAAARCDVAVSRTYFLAPAEAVQWRMVGEHIASAVGRRARHVNLHSTIVRTASIAGEWIGKLTRTAPLANRSKAELSRYPYWVCSGARAQRELGFREARSLPDAMRDTYYWYRQSGWLRGSQRTDSAVA